MSKGSKRKVEHWKVVRLLLMVYDFIAVIVSFGIALWLRFDCKVTSVEPQYLTTYKKTIIIYALFCLVVFWFLRLYKSIWRFASYSELLRVILATVVTGVIYTGSLLVFNLHMPVSYYVIGITVQFIATLGIRFFYRFVLLLRGRTNNEVQKKNVMIIGAGSAGQMLFRDIKHAKETNETVACFIDDNPNKWDRYIDDVPVFGSRDHILEAVDKFNIDKIYVAVPSANPQDKRDILRVCNETSCELMNLPGMYQLYTGQVSVSKMKKVQIEDLLGRDPIKPNMDEVFAYVRNKVVLITGVGSIGSELARQIASHNPKQLVLFDVYENNAYDIQLELRKKYPNLDLVTLIGSVRDSRKMFDLFKKYRPQIVYHAAAHKHVPLMEDSPCESIKNNAMGTYKTAYAAMVHGCEKFVLISTDKAVNPTNIMGASKRLCEMIIQAFAAKIKEGKAYEIPQLFTHEKDMIEKPEIKEALKTTQTEFVAVRFGNVLGSNGSVIPIFKRQIEAGGPVTVTHPDIIRYFMTIPEAVNLVLLAGTYAHGGEIFVLDMGEPVKITTLARNLIRLSGYTPDVDIKLEFTGLMAEEGLKKTKNDLIHIGCPIPFDINEFLGELDGLLDAAYRNEDDMKERVQKIVSTYHPA
mgnify:FL=1